MIALFIPALKPVFELNNTEFGSLYSIATLASASLLPFLGSLLDRLRLKTFSLMTASLMVLACWILASAPSTLFLTIGLMLQRLSGQGLMSQTASISAARYFESARGKALSLATLGLPAGQFIFPPIVTLVIAEYGWRFGFILISFTVLAIFLPITQSLIRKDEAFNQPPAHLASSDATKTSNTHHWDRSRVLRHSYFYMQLPHSLMPAFLLTGLFFHQGSLAQSKGWSLTLIASSFTAFALARTIMSFAVGPLVDRFGAHRLFPFSLFPLMGALICLALGQQPWTAFLYLGLAGMTVGAGGPIKSALWAEAYGSRHLGSIRSLFSTLTIFSTSISPILLGWFLDEQWDLSWLLWGAAALMLMTSTLSALAHPPQALR